MFYDLMIKIIILIITQTGISDLKLKHYDCFLLNRHLQVKSIGFKPEAHINIFIIKNQNRLENCIRVYEERKKIHEKDRRSIFFIELRKHSEHPKIELLYSSLLKSRANRCMIDEIGKLNWVKLRRNVIFKRGVVLLRVDAEESI